MHLHLKFVVFNSFPFITVSIYIFTYSSSILFINFKDLNLSSTHHSHFIWALFFIDKSFISQHQPRTQRLMLHFRQLHMFQFDQLHTLHFRLMLRVLHNRSNIWAPTSVHSTEREAAWSLCQRTGELSSSHIKYQRPVIHLLNFSLSQQKNPVLTKEPMVFLLKGKMTFIACLFCIMEHCLLFSIMEAHFFLV